MDYFITENYESQVKKIFKKLAEKKLNNEKVVNWLYSINDEQRANNIKYCGQYVGITNVSGIARVVKADFCRERLCFVCAWRRQARFLSQMYPVLSILTGKGYRFLFATLTIRNMSYENLQQGIDDLIKGYEKLRHRRKIKRAWSGICRSVELSYNQETNKFHPHIHLLIAVKEDYFYNKDLYINNTELSYIWQECIAADYEPIVDIRAVDNTDKAAVETLKYSLKPSNAEQAFAAFFYLLKGRRLISFCGVFQKIRTDLKYADFENVLTDEDLIKEKKIKYNLYTFDATGGVYRFSQEYDYTL